MENVETKRKGKGGVGKFLLFLLIAAVAMGTYAAYEWGDGHLYIHGETVSEMQPWEVVGAVIIGIVGLVLGLVGGAIGLLIGLAAAAISITLALIGILGSMFLVAGIVLGPFLLIALIVVLARRNGQREVV